MSRVTRFAASASAQRLGSVVAAASMALAVTALAAPAYAADDGQVGGRNDRGAVTLSEQNGSAAPGDAAPSDEPTPGTDDETSSSDPAPLDVTVGEAESDRPSTGEPGDGTTLADDDPADVAEDGSVTTSPNGDESGDTAPDESASAGSGAPVLPIVAIVAGVVGFGAIGLGVRRSRGGTPGATMTEITAPDPGAGRRSDAHAVAPPIGIADPTPAIAELLDATRRMTDALDDDEVARIAVSEGVRFTRAEQGAFARRTADGLELMVETHAGLTNPDRLWSGALRRVVETGQPAVSVVHDEPALARLPMSMLAVPVVVDGRVHGLFVLVRSAAEPFGHREVQTLGMLAPMTGSALKAAESHESAHALVNIDALTSLANRRKLDADLETVSRRDEPIAFAMVDVDHFKHFNDTNGHAAGDEALRRVGAIVRTTVRQGDVVYRYGGEEFSILLPGASPDDAQLVAERVRAAIEAADIPGGENQPAGRVTVSIGVAHRTPGEAPAALAERADAALYRSKSDGRNRVTTA